MGKGNKIAMLIVVMAAAATTSDMAHSMYSQSVHFHIITSAEIPLYFWWMGFTFERK